jgi:hypothetical protein
VFEADYVGEAAAPNNAVTRLKFVWLPISEALTLVGAPLDREYRFDAEAGDSSIKVRA